MFQTRVVAVCTGTWEREPQIYPPTPRSPGVCLAKSVARVQDSA